MKDCQAFERVFLFTAAFNQKWHLFFSFCIGFIQYAVYVRQMSSHFLNIAVDFCYVNKVHATISSKCCNFFIINLHYCSCIDYYFSKSTNFEFFVLFSFDMFWHKSMNCVWRRFFYFNLRVLTTYFVGLSSWNGLFLTTITVKSSTRK